MLIGSSLKMYFSHARTVEWVREVAAIVADHPAREYVTTFAIPQYPSIPAAVEIGGPAGIEIGAQDIATDDEGAFTGEVSGRVLAEIGCRYAEVGHAERRRLFGETEEVVARKVLAALRNGLVPILCVGEAVETDPAAAAQESARQIESGLAEARATGTLGEIVIAYEPLWAIGAPRPAGADRIREVCRALRAHVRDAWPAPASVIYGGSAGPGLIESVAPDVDGLFLGRFAHDPVAFRAILDEVMTVRE